MRIIKLLGPRLNMVVLTGLCGGLIVVAAACGSSSKAGSGTATTGASTAGRSATASDTGTTAYVANVCKAVKQLSDSMGTFGRPGAGATPSASGTPAAGATPGTTPADATARAKALQDAGSTFVAALLASNPPAALQAYNAQVADAVNTAITNISSGNFGRGGGFAGTPRSGTPRARPSGAAQGTPSGTRRAGGRGGGAALFLRNIPAPPAASAAALKLAASQDTNCQAAGFTFGQ